MGIYTYILPAEIGHNTRQLRLHLRFLCDEKQPSDIALHGFAGIFLFSNSPPQTSRQRPHYAAGGGTAAPNCLITNKWDNTSVQLQWSSMRQGFWRLKASISSRGLYVLTSGAGSGWQIALPRPLCSSPSGGHLPHDGIWNVITTTSNAVTKPYVKTMAFLLLEHHEYSRKLGFNGTILRGNAAETQELLKLDGIQQAVDKQHLVLWPWDREHSAGAAPHYWQRPKNQLTLLGAYGRGLRLSFFDLDEYLVIPAGGSIHNARCAGKQLLDPVFGSWAFDRYQAKTCKDSGADMDCWRVGTPLPRASTAQQYWQELCPMGNGKPLFVADAVETMTVHSTYSGPGAKGPGQVPRTCAFLLHFFSLMGARREEVVKRVLSKPASTWSLDEHGRGVIKVDEGVKLFATNAECQDYWALTFGPAAGDGKQENRRRTRRRMMQLT